MHTLRTAIGFLLIGLSYLWFVLAGLATVAAELYASVQAWPNLLVIVFVLPITVTTAGWLIAMAGGVPLAMLGGWVMPDGDDADADADPFQHGTPVKF